MELFEALDRVARGGPAGGHSPQRPLRPGRQRPQRLRGRHVERVRRARPGLGRESRVRQDQVHELSGLQAEV